MAPSATRFLIVRHGETEWNRERRLQGQLSAECPLNETGHQQGKAVRAPQHSNASATQPAIIS